MKKVLLGMTISMVLTLGLIVTLGVVLLGSNIVVERVEQDDGKIKIEQLLKTVKSLHVEIGLKYLDTMYLLTYRTILT